MSQITWQFKLSRHNEPAPDTADPATDPAPDTGTDVDYKAEAEKYKALARKHEDRSKTNLTAAQEAAAKAEQKEAQLAAVLKALGQDGEEPPDPAALTAQIEQAQAAAWRSGVELQVHRLAAKLGGDPEKLLDSMAFIDSLDDLTAADPSSPEFRSEIETKVSAALERNPAYKVAAPAGPRPDPGQGGRPPVVTDFTKADPETFAAELAKYRLRPRTY